MAASTTPDIKLSDLPKSFNDAGGGAARCSVLLQTVNGTSAPFFPKLVTTSRNRDLKTFAGWKITLMSSLKKRMQELGEKKYPDDRVIDEEFLGKEGYEMLLWTWINETIKNHALEVRYKVICYNQQETEEDRVQVQAKLWSLETYFLHLCKENPTLCTAIRQQYDATYKDRTQSRFLTAIGEDVCEEATNNYFLDSVVLIPHLLSSFRDIKSCLKPLQPIVDRGNPTEWALNHRKAWIAFITRCLCGFLQHHQQMNNGRFRTVLLEVCKRKAVEAEKKSDSQRKRSDDVWPILGSPEKIVSEVLSALNSPQSASLPPHVAHSLSSRFHPIARREQFQPF